MNAPRRLLTATAAVRADCGRRGARPRRTRSEAASSADLSYVQAQINKFRAVPKFVAPGPAFDAKARRAARRSSSSRPRARCPFVSTIADHMMRVAEARRRQDDDLAEPGPAVAVGAGDERGDRAEGERDRPARRQRPGRPAAADQGGEGEGDPARSSRTSTTRSSRRRRTSAAVVNIPYNLAGRLIADQAIVAHQGQGQRACRDDQPGQVDRADGGRDQVGVREVLRPGCKLEFTDVDDRRHRDQDPADVQAALTARPGDQLRDLPLRQRRGAVRRRPAIRAPGDGQGQDRRPSTARPRSSRRSRRATSSRWTSARTSTGSARRSSTSRCGSWAGSPRRRRPRPGPRLRQPPTSPRPGTAGERQGWGTAYVGGYKSSGAS